MKKVFLSMCLLASMTLTAVAQQGKGGKRGYDIEQVKGLNLTDSQKEAIKKLKDTYREESRQRAEAHQAAVKALLTPEQQEKWDERAGKRKDKRTRGGAVSTLPAQTIKYDAETTARLEALNVDLQKELKAVKMSRLAPEEQKRRTREIHEKYSALRSQAVSDVALSKVSQTSEVSTGLVAVNPIAPIITFDDVTRTKLETLEAEVEQQKKSIDLSRIAPEMQVRKKEILDQNFRETVAKVLAADPKVIENKGEVPGTTLKLNASTLKKLSSLNNEYLQAEKAIRMTRIAPEMQEKRIKDLNLLYADKRIAIVEAGIK